ncbi:MAG: hypothetical protein Q7I99_08550 [Acholeplasmataceae bacterium]|nr:hypothetical protein [Acholeplasmataceae bacterium]
MKYAIDLPRHQQFYVRCQESFDLRILRERLELKGFSFVDYIGTSEYTFPIFVINYLDKQVFGANTTVMACAMSSKATILSVEQFIKEIVEVYN